MLRLGSALIGLPTTAGTTGQILQRAANNTLAWISTTAITALGTISTGVWQATPIDKAYTTGLTQVPVAGSDTTDVTGAGTLTLYTTNIVQNTVVAGRTLFFKFTFSRTTGSGNVTIRVTWGGVNFEATSTGTAGPEWTIEGSITAAGASNAQRGSFVCRSIAASTAVSQFGASGVSFSADNGAGAVALAVTVSLATSTNHVTMRSADVWLNGA